MAKFVTRSLLALAVLYFAGVAAFALFHYSDGRPEAGEVIADFHAWIVGRKRSKPPPPPIPEAPPYVPPTPPVRPPPSDPPPPTTSAAEVAQVEQMITKAEAEAKALRASERDAEFEARRGKVLVMLGEAREVLNRILEADPRHREANDLWTRLMEIQNAVRHL